MSPRILSVAVICALALAGCGSTGGATTSASNPSNAPLKFAACMRSHGVPNFPDPSGGGDRIQIGPNSGIDLLSPAVESAQQACKTLLPKGGGPPPRPSAADERAGLAWAECVRKHGVPNFPDPSYSANSSAPSLVFRGLQFQVGPNFDPRSPAFRQAQAACGFGPGGGPPPKGARVDDTLG
jgi:hypothetical protein